MYDTHWPRPGPAMAAVAAVLGVVAGALLGLSSAGSEPRAQASAAPETRVVATTTTLPKAFHTVILGSFGDRAGANERLRQVRDKGVDDAGLLDRRQFRLNTSWAVFSGQFESQGEAEAYRRKLLDLGIFESFWKHVIRTT